MLPGRIESHLFRLHLAHHLGVPYIQAEIARKEESWRVGIFGSHFLPHHCCCMFLQKSQGVQDHLLFCLHGW